MKKNVSFLLMLSVTLAVSICISCKSTPPAETATAAAAATTAVVEPSKSAFAVTMGKTEQARQRAMDFDAPAYFPSDWEKLEAEYDVIKNTTNVKSKVVNSLVVQNATDFDLSGLSPDRVQELVSKLGELTVSYDELFNKSIPLYAQAKEDEIMAVREQIINSGFSDVFPQYLKKADDMALDAYAEYEAEDYYKAKESAEEALSEYQTLLVGARVLAARQEIVDRGFSQYDADNFSKADESAQNALKAFEGGDNEGAITSSEEALLRYNLVLANGWTSYAVDRRDAAEVERELAMAERANIAARDTFRSGEVFYNQANELLAAENFRDAGLGFIEAEARYSISRKETEEKRIRAEEAIRIAEEKIEESSGSAVEAERIIEGGSK